MEGWIYYKVPTNGVMTGTNVKATCDSANLEAPCYYHDHSYASSACVHTISSGQTFQRLSSAICGHNSPTSCPQLLDVFLYMYGWFSGDACGVTSSQGYCSRGTFFSNKFSLCARRGKKSKS